MAKRKLAGMNEPAHVGRVYVGLTKQGKSTPSVTKKERAAIERLVASVHGGSATTTKGRGVWAQENKAVVHENTMMVEVVSPGSESCDRFTRRMRAVAQRAARIGAQTGVLALTNCADGKIDAVVVDRNGREVKSLRAGAGFKFRAK